MVLISKPEYKSIRRNLDWIMQDNDIKSINQLGFIMQQRGFRARKDGTRLYPTEKQLIISWEYVQSKAISNIALADILFRLESYKNHSIKRYTGNKPLVYKNKTYRKGQFLPKEYK